MHGWDGARLEGMNELHDLLGATSYLWTKHIPHICHRHHRRCLCKKTLPKALRTQALTALTSNFGMVGLVRWVWLGRFGLVGLVWLSGFGLAGLVW